MTVNERIKNLRLSKGLDIQQVEQLTGIDSNSLYKYEINVTPRANKLKLLADLYHVSVNYLLHGVELTVSQELDAKAPAWAEELMHKIDKLIELQIANNAKDKTMLEILGKLSGKRKDYGANLKVAHSVTQVAKRAA